MTQKQRQREIETICKEAVGRMAELTKRERGGIDDLIPDTIHADDGSILREIVHIVRKGDIVARVDITNLPMQALRELLTRLCSGWAGGER